MYAVKNFLDNDDVTDISYSYSNDVDVACGSEISV